MRKLTSLIAVLAIALIVPMTAFGFGSLVSETTVDPFAGGASNTYSYDDSGLLWFSGDDWAEAGGGSAGDVVGFGQGRLFGFGKTWAEGDLEAFGCSDSYALAIDIPFIGYSEAWAGAETSATIRGEVDAGFKGFAIGDAKAEIEGTVEGRVYQNTYTTEGNPNHGTAAMASGGSSAEFYGKTHDSDYDGGFFCDSAGADVDMTGHANVDGHSVVKIDKYGHNQSAYAMTENGAYANVRGDDFELNKVNGGGSVGAYATTDGHSSGAYAGGNAGFSYNATSFRGIGGSGQAMINADAGVDGGCGGNCFSSSVNASAQSQTGN